uniref:Uncharacterized protein n=1 Tax=Ananas comosus var. bracteatus TaxID=296719 RepID=A0A6V7PD54_ANACO|nr:unnamed protein product [Ananas comosus var. bracteatus]
MKNLSPSSPPFKLKPPEAAAGCLSGILRSFLCGNSDDRDDADLVIRNRERVEEKTPQSPGIEPIDQLRRELAGFLNERYRPSQIKASASFREVPTYLTKENEEFLLLSFGPEDKGEKKKKNKGSREQKSRRREESKTRRKWTADSKTDDSAPRSVCNREGLESSQRDVVLEAECVTQNSSPVSVLDHADDGGDDDDECDAIPNSTTLEEMNPPTKQQSSRRKLTSNFESFDCAFPPIQRDEDCTKLTKKEKDQASMKEFSQMELRSKEGGEDVVAEIGSELLDLLLNEATLELFKNMVYV